MHLHDALSRNPVSDPTPHDALTELDTLDQPDISISEIRASTATHHPSPHLDTLHNLATVHGDSVIRQNVDNVFYINISIVFL